MTDLQSNLSKISFLIENVTECLQGDAEQIGYGLLAELAQDLQEVIPAMHSFTTQIGGPELFDSSETNRIFQEIVGALENKDTVYLTDLLEYELLPVIKGWQVELGRILGREEN